MNPRWFLALGSLAVAYGLYQAVASPLRTHEKSSRQKIVEMGAEIAEARVAIGQIRAKDPLVAEARAEFEHSKSERPASQSLVWFPKKIDRHFRRFGIESPATRFTIKRDEERLPGIERSYWAVDLPMTSKPGEITRALDALAEFEKAEPYARVIQFATGPESSKSGRQNVAISFSLQARK